MLMTVATQSKEVREKTLIANNSRELNIPLAPPIIQFQAADISCVRGFGCVYLFWSDKAGNSEFDCVNTFCTLCGFSLDFIVVILTIHIKCTLSPL